MKRKYLSLLLLPLMVVSCGSKEVNEVGLPDGGQEVTKEEAGTHFKKALKASTELGANDALSVGLEGGYLDFGFSLEMPLPSSLLSSETSSESTMKNTMEFHLSDLNFKAAVKGFTATNVNDIKASSEVRGNFSAKMSGNGLLGQTNVDTSSAIYAAAYIKDGYLYAETDDATANAINNTIGAINKDASETVKKKVKTPLGIKEDDLPLVSQEAFDTILKDVEDTENTALENVKFLKHNNGSYSYSLNLSGADIKKALEDTSSSESSSFISVDSIVTSLKDLDENDNFAIAVIFDDNGLKSVGLKTAIETSYADEKSGTNLSLKLGAGFKFTFAKGSNVTINEPANPKSFELVNDKVSLL
jgi:hypothetical protein